VTPREFRLAFGSSRLQGSGGAVVNGKLTSDYESNFLDPSGVVLA
jgi:hypothetical protein